VGPVTAPVFTGIGVIAPTGVGTEAHWSSVLAGRGALSRMDRFDVSGYPVSVGGQVRGFTAAERLPSRLTVQTDYWTHMGVAAADMALADAGAVPSTMGEYEMGVNTASSSGGTEFGQHEMERLWARGPQHVTVFQSIAWFYAATTGQISIRHGMRGRCGVISAEQAGGLDALAAARSDLHDGAKLMLTGGTDASLCPYGLVAQITNGLLSERAEPDRAYLPFDTEACGYSPGEGGAILVLEDADAARERGAPPPYGTLAGHGATFDPAPVPPGGPEAPGASPPPGTGLSRAVEIALRDARLRPADIGLVLADAAGVPDADRAEARAIRDMFGDRAVPVTAPKTMTGRLYAGGAPLDVASALLAIRDQVIPPTINVSAPVDADGIDLAGEVAREARIEHVLVLARGHGGFNSAAVISAWN
jgi:act minimal PKS chain-length factor (CLF/KS beta)